MYKIKGNKVDLEEIMEQLETISQKIFHIKTEMLKKSTDAGYMRELAKKLEKLL